MTIYEESLKAHKQAAGKIAMVSKVPLETRHDLSIYYSPGVAAVSKQLAEHPEQTPLYTGTNNSVAVISDGTSVLGLGDIGPYGAMPVMEGKAILFKRFANIDAVPIVLNTKDPDEIIDTVTVIAPSFGGINLEDIAAPQCFYIEDELQKRLDIPVMHDDQHGTAVVVLAGLINATKLTGRTIADSKIVLIGAGAAGVAIAKLLHTYANPNIIAVDSKGVISNTRPNLSPEKTLLASFAHDSESMHTLSDALKEADIFIGVSRGGLLTEAMVKSMATQPIIFALANPEPEIAPKLAKKAGAAVVATGRSDFPNQVNNVLAFPGLFRGALDKKSKITDTHKIAAAEALANSVKHVSADMIIPDPLKIDVTQTVAAVFSQQ